MQWIQLDVTIKSQIILVEKIKISNNTQAVEFLMLEMHG